MKIKCNKCEYVGEDSEFPKGQDFFQNAFIKGCPKCDNHQNPSDAAMRCFGGDRPFERVDDTKPIEVTDRASAFAETMRRAKTIS